jgi:hypothetical protein
LRLTHPCFLDRWTLFIRIGAEDAMATPAIEFSADGSELYWLDGRDTAAVIAQDLRTGNFLQPCREFKSAIREISAVIRECRSRPLFWPTKAQ